MSSLQVALRTAESSERSLAIGLQWPIFRLPVYGWFGQPRLITSPARGFRRRAGGWDSEWILLGWLLLSLRAEKSLAAETFGDIKLKGVVFPRRSGQVG